MAAAITDKITKTTNGSRPVPTTLTSDLPSGASPGTAACGALTGWDDTTAMHFIIYNINPQGQKIAGTQTDWKGIVVGNNITNLTLQAGSNTGYSVGAVVEAAPTAAWADDLADALLETMNPEGGLKPDVEMTTPQITTAVKDSNGNEVLRIPATGSAVNDITIRNAATGSAPSVEASGDDTNIGIQLKGKGSGDAAFAGNHTGWVYDADTYVYVSATSFKITGKDVRSRFPVGARIALNQSGDKFFYVAAVPTFSTDTTVTITGGSDYSLANAAITNPRYSYEPLPQGFPVAFNITPTTTNVTLGTGGTHTGRFSMNGGYLDFKGAIILGTGGQFTGNITILLPIAAKDYSFLRPVGQLTTEDTGTDHYHGSVVQITDTTLVQLSPLQGSNSTDINVHSKQFSSSNPYSSGNTDRITYQARLEAVS